MAETNELIIVKQRLHDKQRDIIRDRKRFNVIKSGRRFGKSALSINLLIESVLKGHYVGFFYPNYKDGLEVWDEVKNRLYGFIQHKDESAKIIRLLNGAKVDFWSMDDPNSGRGRKYHRAIMDECEKAGKFEEAWEQAIAPTLTDYGGDAYFLSTPKFGETYFKSLCKHNQLDPKNWATFIYTTYDNPHIPREEIELMRAILHPSVFDCEYLAIDVDGKTLNPFAHQYDPLFHESKDIRRLDSKPIYISIDFNLNPFAVTFWHHWQDHTGYHFWAFDEAEIEQGSIPAMIDLIKVRYGQYLHSCVITGDAMGNQGNIALRDNASHYLSLQRGLGLGKHQIQVPANPTHENSRDDVNKILFQAKQPESRYRFLINPTNCPNLSRDFRSVQCDATGQIAKKNRKDLNQRADYLDTGRYFINLTAKPLILRNRI